MSAAEQQNPIPEPEVAPVGSGARFAGIWLGAATSQSLVCRTKPDRHFLGIHQ